MLLFRVWGAAEEEDGEGLGFVELEEGRRERSEFRDFDDDDISFDDAMFSVANFNSLSLSLARSASSFLSSSSGFFGRNSLHYYLTETNDLLASVLRTHI